MKIITNLQGRLRNASLPYSSGLLPIFEMVANSIHTIEDADLDTSRGYIEVRIVRNRHVQLDLGTDPTKQDPESKDEVQGFEITDNGVGFNRRSDLVRSVGQCCKGA